MAQRYYQRKEEVRRGPPSQGWASDLTVGGVFAACWMVEKLSGLPGQDLVHSHCMKRKQPSHVQMSVGRRTGAQELSNHRGQEAWSMWGPPWESCREMVTKGPHIPACGWGEAILDVLLPM